MSKTADNELLEHKGYYGSVEYDLESKMLYGQLLGIKGAYIYEGKTLDELEADFKEFVEDYLYDCEQDGVRPQRPNLVNFNVSISEELYFKICEKAKERGLSLDSFIQQAIEHELER
ncbi:type II toxin-antitoxin system HicB family antitoxin [Dysgonomonas sp. Marseille-P4677]|uniref:type II toxin-antitoxin system HicB family antitoxin n=1 Tax=Dysgonomonas sp. Marseille-P4677 TaxID=2364790 RepID=UPI001912FDEB|nr:type II toxin-antitoxin system HicB family antitoxin [Dysgonomonas sp. Marseille-P4677]MBK5719887.1 type II toxin-antitoxin system HicB family antitoxin [Dysgonomonas sp. Marseille-P4677]